MKNRDKESLSFGRVFSIVLIIIGIILVFTFLDYLVHQLSTEYAVPDYYFRNKIIYGSLWAILFYFIIRKWNKGTVLKSLVFSALISIVLQARYAYEGYSWEFVIEFLFFHFFILWIVSGIAFKAFRKCV